MGSSHAAALQSSAAGLHLMCSWIASHVVLQLDLLNLAMKAATKEYTVVSWGDITLNPDAILSLSAMQ